MVSISRTIAAIAGLFASLATAAEKPNIIFIMDDGSSCSWRGVPSTSLRRGKYKMIEFIETDTVALYDLSQDPGETRDVSAEQPEVVKKLRAELDAWQAETKAPIPSTPNPKFLGLKKLKTSL